MEKFEDGADDLQSQKKDIAEKNSEESNPDNVPPFKLSFAKEAINNEINYLWIFSGYKNLTEFLLDFQAERHIGTLSFERGKIIFSKNDVRKIDNYVTKYGDWLIRVFIKNHTVNTTLLHIVIPVQIVDPIITDSRIEYKIISGKPRLDNFQSSPI